MNRELLSINILNSEIKKDRVSHAYLFVGMEMDYIYKKAIDFANSILKEKNYEEKSIDLLEIEPKNNIISKDEILDLEKQLKTKSIKNNKRIYIIKNCDKMNSYASNALLKFLEEPEKNIIAILLTNNLNNTIDTIKSRCKIYFFSSNLNVYDENSYSTIFDKICSYCNMKINIDESEKQKYVVEQLQLLKRIIVNYKDVLIYENINKNHLLSNKISQREENEITLYLFLLVFYDIYKYKNNLKIDNGVFYNNNYISELSDLISIEKIENNINEIIKNMERIEYNLNNKLFINNLIIRLG